jgi:hypothetical protein
MRFKTNCPVCNNNVDIDMSGLISCTVRCKKCDSSIGLSVTGHISVVYSDVLEEEWHCNVSKKLN